MQLTYFASSNKGESLQLGGVERKSPAIVRVMVLAKLWVQTLVSFTECCFLFSLLSSCVSERRLAVYKEASTGRVVGGLYFIILLFYVMFPAASVCRLCFFLHVSPRLPSASLNLENERRDTSKRTLFPVASPVKDFPVLLGHPVFLF